MMRGVHEWPATRLWFDVSRGPTVPLLGITVALDATAASASMAVEFDRIRESFGSGGNEEDIEPAIEAACDTGGALSAGGLTHDAYGVPLAARLAGFASEASAWLLAGDTRGAAPAFTIFLPLAPDVPSSWPADLRALTVRLLLADDTETAVSDVPPVEFGAFARTIEDAFDGFDGRGTRIKVATSRDQDVWLLRWGGPGGIAVTFRSDTHAPVALLVPVLGAASITRDVDGRTFANVELDSLASEFLSALDGIAPRTEEIAVIRRDLAAAIAATVVPAWQTPGGAFNTSAAAEGVARMLEEDVTLALRAAALAQISARVEGRIGALAGPVPERRLSGTIVLAHGDFMRTGGVPLVGGDRTLEVMLVPADPGASRSAALEPVLSAESIDGTGAPSLRFTLPESMPLGSVEMPVPLRAAPPPVSIREVAATQDDDSDAGGFKPTWRFAVTVERPAAAQDVVAVRIAFDGSGGDPGAARAVVTAPAQAALFDALARFMMAHASGAAGTVEHARAVVEAWTRWTPDAAPERGQADDSPVATYEIALDTDGAALVVAAGEPSTEPVLWPVLVGYSMERPAPGVRRARFLPADGAAPGSLTLAFGSLDPRRIGRAGISAWIERNRNVAPAGLKLDSRFIRRGTISTANDVAPPTLRNVAPITLPPASSLLVALQGLFAAIDAPAGMDMSIAYSYPMGAGMRARLPVLVVSRETWAGGGATPPDLARVLLAWKEQTSPPAMGGAFEFEIKVWGGDQKERRTTPLFWFTDVTLETADAPGWWSAGPGQTPGKLV